MSPLMTREERRWCHTSSGARQNRRGAWLHVAGLCGGALAATAAFPAWAHAQASPSATTPPASSAPTAPTAPSTLAPPHAHPPGSAPVGPPPAEGALTAPRTATPPPPPVEVPAPRSADPATGPTDHALVVGRWGIEARRVSAAVGAFALRPDSGCPAVAATGSDPMSTCEVPINGLLVRHWVKPGFAWNAGLALALGGGRFAGSNLDTYVGAGPIVGVTLLLGQWKHVAVGASPELTWVIFKPSGSASAVHHLEVLGALEAEIHFGFIGLPSLTVAFKTGLRLELDRDKNASVWALGFSGPSSAWGLLNNLHVRYYF